MDAAPITQHEVPEFVEALFGAFHGELHQEARDRVHAVIEPDRSLAIRDDGRIVATAGIFTRRMTIPGGEVPVAAVTMVGVRASHRRRGFLTSMMRRQLSDVHDAGTEAIAALWASEGAIYGRFGYGMASLTADMGFQTRDARLRVRPEARARLELAEDLRSELVAIYDVARLQVPGMLDRSDAWWDRRLADPEHERDGAGRLRAVVIEGSAYALYGVKTEFGPRGPDGEVRVREVIATSPEGNAAVWAFLLDLDLVRRLSYEPAPADDPLPHLVTSAQAVRMDIGEALWVRLVDVPRALTERTYAVPFEVVLEVADEVCPWNAGRWALAWDGTTATCERTTLDAGLELSATELGAAYLGGTPLELLARALRVRELKPGALAAASLAFRGERQPWCPEIF